MKPYRLSGPSLIIAIGALLAASAAAAADPAADAAASPQAASSACDAAHQDPAACQREKGAAKQEARRGGLTSVNPDEERQNALARCDVQPPAARAECAARIRGSGNTSVEGSVKEGGVLRETETPVPAGR